MQSPLPPPPLILGLTNSVKIKNAKYSNSAKILRSDSYTKVVNYSIFRGIISKSIDIRYITFMQKHLVSIQSQRDCKIHF